MNKNLENSKSKLAIVILNYEAYNETETCIDSILSRKITFEGIVIVDNASTNESVEYLKNKYCIYKNIRIIRSIKNVGFAKGNNLGIKFAKRTWNADFILLLNSDTLMLQDDYVERMMRQYQEGIAVIQSNALRTNGRYTSKTYISFSVKDLCVDYLRGICTAYDIFCGKLSHHQGDIGPFISGCDFLLTPSFFQVFHGLYPLTFLFQEEPILMLMLKRVGLHSSIAEDALLLHKESMSTPNSLKIGGWKRKKVLCTGYLHTVLVRIMPIWMLRKIVNRGNW